MRMLYVFVCVLLARRSTKLDKIVCALWQAEPSRLSPLPAADKPKTTWATTSSKRYELLVVTQVGIVYSLDLSLDYSTG